MMLHSPDLLTTPSSDNPILPSSACPAPAFRNVSLIYNPASGQRHARRQRQIEAAAEVLREAGIEVDAIPTTGPGTAGEQARTAIAQGCDAILAGGGDGTVHEVLQGIAGTSAMLGVIPLGTGNTLAADIGLPRDPAAAAKSLLTASPMRVAAGLMEYQRSGTPHSRYFMVNVGIGPDAHLFYKLDAAAKQRFGYGVYLYEALRIWATHEFPLFEIEYSAPSGEARRELVSQVLAVRISNFGGALRCLAPGAALHKDMLRLVLFKTRSRARFLQFVTGILCGRCPRIPGIELVDAVSLACRNLPREEKTRRVYAEADGEYLGVLPVSMRIVPNAVTLLMPKG